MVWYVSPPVALFSSNALYTAFLQMDDPFGLSDHLSSTSLAEIVDVNVGYTNEIHVWSGQRDLAYH